MMRRFFLSLVVLLQSAEAFRLPLRMSDSRANPLQALAQQVKGALQQQEASRSFPKLLDDQTSDPGLKVGPVAWKWPPVWPYPADSFTVKKRVHSDSDEAQDMMKRMFDALPSLSQQAQKTLGMHYQRFLGEGDAEVLLLSDIETSWSPTLEARDCGLAVSCQSFDLQTLDGSKMPFESDSFDYVFLPGGTIRYATNPREVLREVWRVCRPGGIAFVSFYNKKAADVQLAASESATIQTAKDNTVKVWQSLNDAQRMWVVGSMFQFSAGVGTGGGDAGWEDLRGYELTDDIYNPTELDEDGDISTPEVVDDLNTVYVVQARKQSPPTAEQDPYKAMMYKLALANKLNEPDRQLVSLRLAAELKDLTGDEAVEKERVADQWATATIDIYEILKEMNAVFGPDLRALLAAMIVPHTSRSNAGTTEILSSLQEGLGLGTVGEFWEKIGETTKTMPPEDRVYLLGTLAPYFGEPSAKDALGALPEILKNAVEIVTNKLYPVSADMYYEIENPDQPTRADCQVLAVDLVLSDYLGVDGGSTNIHPPVKHLLHPSERKGFLHWLASVESDILREWSTARRVFKEEALRIHEEDVQSRLAASSRNEEDILQGETSRASKVETHNWIES